jgi:ABC-type branched-subunit amino acid transport system substrate-binding protein
MARHYLKFKRWGLLGVSTLATSLLVGVGFQSIQSHFRASSDPPLGAVAAQENAPQPASGEPIKIGGLLPLTGDLQAFGETTLNGINLAFNSINSAGGVMGRPLGIETGDTQTSPQLSIDTAQRMISVEGAVAILGDLASGNTIAVARSVTSSSGIPQISNASTSPEITTLDDNDFLFRTVPSDAFQGIALADIVRQKGVGKVAVVYINNDYGEGLAQSFKQALEAKGGTVTSSVPYEPGQASYRGELSKLADGNAEALALFGYPENGITILKQSLEEGFFDKFIFSDGMKAPEVIDAIGAEFLNGAYGTVAQAPTDSKSYQTFISAYEAEYGELPPKPYIDNAYDAATILALAMQKAGSTDGEAVRNALRDVANPPGMAVGPGEWAKAVQAIANGQDIDYVGASGSSDFDKNGDVAGSFEHWAIEDGKLVTVEVFEPEV